MVPPAARFPDGEDFHEAHERLTGVLLEITSGLPGRSLTVISHGEILTQVLARLVELPAGTEAVLDTAAAIVLDRDGDRWRCLSWNSTEHLASLVASDR